MVRVGEMVFHREEHSNQFSCTKWSAQTTCIQGASYRMSKSYKEKVGHEFEEVMEGHGRKRNGEMV